MRGQKNFRWGAGVEVRVRSTTDDTAMEIPDLSILEFLEKFSAKHFAL